MLPPGMALAANSGAYTGTPTAIGTFSFTVQAANPAGTATLAVMQQVNTPPPNAHVLLTGNRLAPLNTLFPSATLTATALTGVVAGESLVAIDRRPANGMLYGLGVNAAANTGTLYAITPSTNLATPLLASAIAFIDGVGNPVSFTAARWGLDFNPTVDRVRVVNSAGVNFRVNPNTGAPIDGNLASTVIAGVNPDGPLNGSVTALDEVAYTNNALNSTVTTLYGINSSTDSLVIMNPPNAGTTVASVPLSTAVDGVLGFDLVPGVNAASSSAPVTAGSGVAIVQLPGFASESLVNLNLVTGTISGATSIGTGGIIGLAVQQQPDHPAYALSDGSPALLRFYKNTPGTVTTVTVTGVAANEVLVGIDFRPATGQLMGLGVNGGTVSGTLYLLDPMTGGATAIGSPGGITPLTAAAGGYGFDFNPTVDRIRVVGATGLNLRLNPATGALAAGDSALNGGATDGCGSAYVNSNAGATTTTLYTLDATTDSLFLQNPPNAGTLTLVATLTLGGNPLNFTALGGFDIPPPAAGPGYAVLTVGGTTSLYSLDLVTGVATLVGAIGPGSTAMVGLALGRVDL
jgi:hypothetical protein